jgi:hypothetical protein
MIETPPFFKKKINVQPGRDSNLGPSEYRTAAAYKLPLLIREQFNAMT